MNARVTVCGVGRGGAVCVGNVVGSRQYLGPQQNTTHLAKDTETQLST